MKFFCLNRLFCILLFVLCFNWNANHIAYAQDNLARESLVISSNGRQIEFTIEIASTKAERAIGLMHRQSMEPYSGMLFDYGNSQNVAMWMKNTYVSLDILFIDHKGVIQNITQNTTPLSLEVISSGGPVLGVLEVKAGTVKAFKIKAGDTVLHALFENSDS